MLQFLFISYFLFKGKLRNFVFSTQKMELFWFLIHFMVFSPRVSYSSHSWNSWLFKTFFSSHYCPPSIVMLNHHKGQVLENGVPFRGTFFRALGARARDCDLLRVRLANFLLCSLLPLRCPRMFRELCKTDVS